MPKNCLRSKPPRRSRPSHLAKATANTLPVSRRPYYNRACAAQVPRSSSCRPKRSQPNEPYILISYSKGRSFMTPARVLADLEDLQMTTHDLDRHLPIFTDTTPDGRHRVWTGKWDADGQIWTPNHILIDGTCHNCLDCSNANNSGRKPDSPKTAMWTCIRTEVQQVFIEAAARFRKQYPDRLEAILDTAIDNQSSRNADTARIVPYCLTKARLALTDKPHDMTTLMERASDIAINLDTTDWSCICTDF